MTTVIVVTLALAAVGIVVDQLARLSKWLKKNSPVPPETDGQEPPDQKT